MVSGFLQSDPLTKGSESPKHLVEFFFLLLTYFGDDLDMELFVSFFVLSGSIGSTNPDLCSRDGMLLLHKAFDFFSDFHKSATFAFSGKLD